MRLFVAIPLPAPILDMLESSAHRLRRRHLPGRTVARDAIHLTLKFLGNVGEEKVRFVEEALSDVGKQAAPFELTVSRPGVFPNHLYPRVIFLGVEESAPLLELQACVEESLQPLGFQQERRAYAPHLTLMRLKSRPSQAQLQGWIEEELRRKGKAFVARDFNLYESRLSSDGASHRVVARFQLGAADS